MMLDPISAANSLLAIADEADTRFQFIRIQQTNIELKQAEKRRKRALNLYSAHNRTLTS